MCRVMRTWRTEFVMVLLALCLVATATATVTAQIESEYPCLLWFEGIAEVDIDEGCHFVPGGEGCVYCYMQINITVE